MKTADEMFADMGFEKGKMFGVLCYRNEKTEREILVGKAGGKPCFNSFSNYQSGGMTADEILACAQLIHEMEVNHD